MNSDDAASKWTACYAAARMNKTNKQTTKPTKRPKLRLCLRSPLADVVDDGDVGEEVVVLRRRHGSPQSVVVLEVAHQDAQAVQVRVLRSDDLKDGLRRGSSAQRTAEGHFTLPLLAHLATCQAEFDSFFFFFFF